MTAANAVTAASRLPAAGEPGAAGSGPEPLLALLHRHVRAEFAGPMIVARHHQLIFGGRPCLVTGCETTSRTQRLCSAHYLRWWKQGMPGTAEAWASTASPEKTGTRPLKVCAVRGCGRGGTLCASHILGWTKLGQPPLEDYLPTVAPVGDTERTPPCAVGFCSVRSETGGGPGSRLCRSHQTRWYSRSRPDIAEFVEFVEIYNHDRFDLTNLPEQLRLEVAYGLQCRLDDGRAQAHTSPINAITREVRRLGAGSLLEVDAGHWKTRAEESQPNGVNDSGLAFVSFTVERLEDLIAANSQVDEMDRDVWALRRLPAITRGSGPAHLNFTRIEQRWLRELAKRWTRMRVAQGRSSGSLTTGICAVSDFSAFLQRERPGSTDASAITREGIERFLASCVAKAGSHETRRHALTALRLFLRAVHHHGWAPEIPRTAVMFDEDVPGPPKTAPRFLSEYVMAQLEDEANLARLAPDYRLVTMIMMQTGMRVGDTCQLSIDCIHTDQAGAAYLHFRNHKMNRDAAIPIAAKLFALIREQQQAAHRHAPDCPVLFPQRNGNPRGTRALTTGSYRDVLRDWLTGCDVRDEHGLPAHVTPHRFRHTFGTRMINNKVPEEIVRRLLDHTSHEMTQRYAHIHDQTVRDAWETAHKVDHRGDPVAVTADSPLADAEWMKHNLARAKMALPNGYCGLPLQQSCPHANACLDCPVFVTTDEFLPMHREQLASTRRLIATAQADGRFRMVEMNQRVETNLTRIITALEDPTEEDSHAC